MEIAVIADESRPRELAHARMQVGRLRRTGFRIVGPSRSLTRDQRASVCVLHAVGAGAWRLARRLGKRLGVPVIYDHPPGATLPSGLRHAAAVIASGHFDATALAHLRRGGRIVVVPPDPPRRTGSVPRPRLRRRVGVDGRTIALQEADGVSRDLTEALIRAVSVLPDPDLVFLGSDRWELRAELARLAEEAQVEGRVHFFRDVPTARRVEYLAEADVGLALGDAGCGGGRLPAADIFDMLGVPFVTALGCLDPRSANGVASAEDPVALRAAIAEASQRERMPAREDSIQILEDLIDDLVAPGGWNRNGTSAAGPSAMSRSDREANALSLDEDGADSLLGKAKRLRDTGDADGAVALYRRVAHESQAPVAIATAAAGLARLDARDEAWAAVERTMDFEQRPALATVRAGEAAAVLGDLVRARGCAGAVTADPEAPQAALRNAIRVLEQAGEPRAALRVARRIGDQPGIARIEGTLESYDPSWLPGRRHAPTPLPSRPGCSLALLETSLPHVRSGYTYRAQTLLRAQRQAGVEPLVLTRLGFPATRGLSAPPREEVDGVTHHRADLPGVKHYTSVPVTEQLAENVRWAGGLAREFRPEGIVAATPHLNGLIGLALRRRLGIPLIYDVRGFPEMTWAVRKGGGDTDAFGLRRVAETRCMREADLVVTLSETMRGHIVGRGVAADRVHVLPHAVDTDAFAPRERDRELAVGLGFGARPVVGYISSLVPYEGVETLVEAIALARRSNPDIAGVIVGDGELLPSLEAQAARLGLDGHLVFTGRVEASEVMRYYSLTDVFVCPRQDHEVTRYVTPLKPFEAMAAGSCIAVSDLPTLREAVRDGECGALFPAGDAPALAKTIVDLIARPERRRALEHAAREHVLAHHGFDTLRSRFEEVWDELRRRSEVLAA